MNQPDPPITPSLDALLIDAAHKSLRDALGTYREPIARAYLEIVVANAKARRAIAARDEVQP